MLRNTTRPGVFLACLLLLLFAPRVAPAAQRSLELAVAPGSSLIPSMQVYQNSWAVIIGINTYKHTKIPQLRYAVNDALSVQAALEPLGFPPQRIFTLLNNEATRHSIEQTLYERLRRTQPV